MTAQKTIFINAADVTVLGFHRAELTGQLRASRFWIENWTEPEDRVAWNVYATQAGEYAVSALYECQRGAEGSAFEILGANRIPGAVRYTGNAWSEKARCWNHLAFDRVPLDGVLRLPAGMSTITMCAVSKPDAAPEVMKLFSLELTSLAAGPELKAKRKRAEALRSSTQWLIDSRYGLMVTWAQRTYPRRSPRKPFQEAVRDFDVHTFAQTVEEAGAGYVILSTTHGPMYFIAPIQAIEWILPGRTSERDLIADLADALGARGIKLMLYYHPGSEDPEWEAAAGYDARYYAEDMSQYWEHQIEILTEISLRYGPKVAGYFSDDGVARYMSDAPWERTTRALKASNPERIVTYNSWIMPKLSDFYDFWVGESPGSLLPPPDASCFAPGGWQGGLQAHLNPFLDDDWAHYEPDTDIRPPLFNDEELIRYVRQCIAAKAVPSINVGTYQDGTMSPATLAQMQALRRVVKGYRVQQMEYE